MLRGAQAKLWGFLEGNNAEAPFLSITANGCRIFAPDTEDYSSLYTSSALDAVAIACNALNYVDSGRTELLVDSASLRRDSVYLFLRQTKQIDASKADFELRMLTHPLMQEELGFQDADLTFLADHGAKVGEGWAAILGRSVGLGYSNLRMLPPHR